MQPLDQSIVRSIEVQPGDAVRAGQIVAKLDPTFTGADRDAMAAQVSALQAQEMRLRAEVEDRPFAYTGPDPILSLQAAIFGQRQADYNSRLESYRHKIDSLSATTVRLRSDIASYKSRVEYAQEAVNVRKELEQLKLGSKLNSLQALDLLAEAQRNLASTEHAAAAAQQDLAALVAERNSFVQSWHSEAAEKLADVVSKLSDAREALSKAQLRNQLVELRAPRDATVMSVSKISVGSVVSPGQQIIESRFNRGATGNRSQHPRFGGWLRAGR